jgi:hypothetical protein
MEIFRYLESCRGNYVSAQEISRRASSRKRYQEEPKWAAAALHRLMDSGIVETNSSGHYRLRSEHLEEKPKPTPPKEAIPNTKRWISPHIQKILQDSGKKFDEGKPSASEGKSEK